MVFCEKLWFKRIGVYRQRFQWNKNKQKPIQKQEKQKKVCVVVCTWQFEFNGYISQFHDEININCIVWWIENTLRSIYRRKIKYNKQHILYVTYTIHTYELKTKLYKGTFALRLKRAFIILLLSLLAHCSRQRTKLNSWKSFTL